MIHENVTQMVSKKVVGKQNVLPLIRDCAEDEREMILVLDTARQRYRGNPVATKTGPIEYLIIEGDYPGPGGQRRNRITVNTDKLLAARIESVLGCATPTEVTAKMHMAEKAAAQADSEENLAVREASS